MIRVSAGIIRREDGCVLICRRGEGRLNASLWEFPGGKQEAGESAADCLMRELQEELSLPVTAPALLCTREAQGITFDFLACDTAAEPVLTEHTAYAWVKPRQLLQYDLCPVDRDVATALAVNDPPLRHFLWDFDGTLMDTYPATVRVFMDACRRLNIDISPDYVLDLMKDNLKRCIEQVARENGLTFEEMNAVFREEEKTIRLDEVPPLPGIPETLRALKALGGHHYLATHRDRLAWEYLRTAGLLDLFDGGILKDDGLPRKPAPDMVLAAIER